MLYLSRLFILILSVCYSESRPSSSPISSTTPVIEALAGDPEISLNRLEIVSDIQFRYARTQVSAYYKNPSLKTSQEAKFRINLPQEAFISNLSMILNNGEVFVAQVKEKEEAKADYEEAVSSGSTAGLVSASFQDSSREFTVQSNVEPSQKVHFIVVYEELLPRTRSYYEHAINLDTKGFIIPNFSIRVNINESLPLTYVSVPEILDESNLIEDAKGASFVGENSEAIIERNLNNDPSKARISLSISEEYQSSHSLRDSRFAVRYDVDRKEENEIQVIDGYFVHFIVPKDSGKILPKHVVFVLDVSGSMQGEKIDQMKDAMISIIDELGPEDRFNILTFSDDVWNWTPSSYDEKESMPNPTSIPATDFYKEQALKFVLGLVPIAGTNINSGMLEGLAKIKDVSMKEEIPYGAAKMILFLTDGQATSGTTNSKTIVSNVVKNNDDALIYGLAFGSGADFDLIRIISNSNGGFARRIHAGADAALQLENFFSEISSPIFSDLQVEYVGGLTQNVTEPKVKTFFRNQEMIIVGKINENADSSALSFYLNGTSGDIRRQDRFIACLRPGPFDIRPPTSLPPICPIPPPETVPPKSKTQNFIERLWAFKTIKNTLQSYNNELKAESPNSTLIEVQKKKALDLSLKYNFVTSLTSLVVTRQRTFDLTLDEIPNFHRGQIPQRVFFSAPKGRLGAPSFRRSSFGIPTSTTTYRPLTTDDYESEPLDYEEDFHVDNNFTDCSGNITLFTKTYLRGDNLTISLDEASNLNDFKAVSLQVEGNCCWTIFKEANFRGEFTSFSHIGGRKSNGVYNSASEVGNIFRQASSLKKSPCHF